MPDISPIHNLEVGYLIEYLREADCDFSLLPVETRQFIATIRSGQRVNANLLQEHVGVLLTCCPEPAVGLKAAQRVSIHDLGAFGHALLSSQNLRSAYQMLATYRAVLQTIHDISQNHVDGQFVFAMTNLRTEGPVATFFTECWLVGQQTLIRSLLGSEKRFTSVNLVYKRPDFASSYEDFFDCPVNFNKAQTDFSIPQEFLDIPFALSNPEIHRFCEQLCEEIMKSIGKGEATVNRARETLLRNPGWFPTCDELAQSLQFSPRTFRRRLQQENSNYQKVLDSVRKELAANYLQSTSLTVEMIALRLGYEEANSFYKAFKRWYGVSPRNFASQFA